MKNKKMKFIICLLLIHNNVFSKENYKDFYKKVYQAEVLYSKGDLDSAILTYELAFTEIQYVNSIYIANVLSLSKAINDKERIKKYKRELKLKYTCIDEKMLESIDSLWKEDQKTFKGKYIKAYKYLYLCDNDTLCSKNTKKYIEAKSLYSEHDRILNKTNIEYWSSPLLIGQSYFELLI